MKDYNFLELELLIKGIKKKERSLLDYKIINWGNTKSSEGISDSPKKKQKKGKRKKKRN